MRAFARLAKALLAMFGFALLFGGIATGLVVLVGWPLPDHWPTTDEWLAWFTSDGPISDRVLIDGAACVIWLLWALALGYLIVATVREIRLPHLRVSVRRQGVVSGLVSAVVLGASRAAAAHTGGDAVAPATAGTATTATTTPATDADEAAGPTTYTVRAGDTLWDIAEAQTGNPLHYQEIADDNYGRAEPDGRHFSDPDLIYPGWTLELPDQAKPTAPPPPHRHEPTHRPGTHAQPSPSTATPSPSATAPSTAPTSTPDRTLPSTRDGRASDGWITLPGGSLISIALAGSISTALAAVAVIRWRRRYRPRSTDSDHAAAGPPMPPLVEEINTAIHATSTDPDGADEHDPIDQPDPLAVAGQPAPGTSQPAASSLALLDGQDPISLHGADAPAAARGLLLAALTSRHHQVVATRTVIDRILHGVVVSGLPGLRVVDTLDEALTALDLHLIEAAGDDDLDDPHAATGLGNRQMLVLFATDIPPAHQPRLDALITQPQLGAVLLPGQDEASAGRTDPAGHPEDTPELDLISLDDALTLLDALRPEPAEPSPPTDTPAPEPPAEADPASDEHPPSVIVPAQVRLLGAPTILMPDGTPADGLRDRAAAFLTYLAIHRRTGADADELLDATGLGRVRRASANQRLYTDISNLRTVLAAAAGDTSDSPRRYIVRSQGRYHIDPTRVTVDLWDLQDAIQHAATATSPDQRIDALHTAVNTYTGDLGHGIDYLWALDARETALTDALNAATALADHYATTDPHRSLGLLNTAIGWSPYAEHLYQHAMRLHARLSDPAGIRMVFSALATRLRNLESSPSPESRQLATTLINHHRASGSPAPPPPPSD